MNELREQIGTKVKHINNSVDHLTDLSEEDNLNNHSMRLMIVHGKHLIDRTQKLINMLEEQVHTSKPIKEKQPKILVQGKLEHGLIG